MSLGESAFRFLTQAHVKFYKATGGTFAGKNLLLLTTIGRKSGQPRVNPLMRIEDGDYYVVAGSAGGSARHPGWYHNLTANPQVQVQVGRTVEDRIARVTEGKERERLWQRFVTADKRFAAYQERTDRTIPVIALEPTPVT